MPPARRDFGEHKIEWGVETNSIKITPRYPNASKTLPFGLGNATITLNLSNLPEDGIVLPITGETNGAGLIPTSPFSLKRWYGMPTGVHNVNKTLTGFNEFEFPISYPEASSGSVKEVTPVNIVQNGYGIEEIVPAPDRLNW